MARHYHKHSKTKPGGWIDKAIYFFVFATPLFELPLAYVIYKNQSSANVSYATWIFFLISSVFFLIYGLRHKIFPLIICYSLYLVIEVIIVGGIFMYY